MNGISRWKIVLFTCLVLVPGTLMAQDQFSLTLQANQSAIEFIGEAGFHLPPSTLYVGTNVLYDEDDYTVVGLQGHVGNIVEYEGLTGKVGLKAVVGDFEHPVEDSDLMALAFSAGVQYDLSDVVASYYIPVILSGTLNIGPKPLSFDDTDEYIEAVAAVDWKFLENAAITASYRYIEVDFERPVRWQKTDRDGYLGVKFIF